MPIDLHVHSTASDGTQSPSEVMAAAAGAGLEVVALTDHDNTGGWVEASHAAGRLGVVLVPGMEVSTQVRGIGVHLLSYLHDPADPVLAAELARTRHERLHRARRMVDLMTADLGLTWDDVLEHVHGAATVGRPHLADALVAKGIVADRDEAFATLLHGRSRYYLPHYAPDTGRIIELVRAAGGVPVLAHPRAGRRGRTLTDDDITALAAAGLAGLEVDHRDHDEAQKAELGVLAERLGLLRTGSSDYHGAGKRNVLGEHTTSPQVLAALIAAGTPRRVVRP